MSSPDPAGRLSQLLVEFRNDADLARIGHYGLSAESVLLYLDQIAAGLREGAEARQDSASPPTAGTEFEGRPGKPAAAQGLSATSDRAVTPNVDHAPGCLAVRTRQPLHCTCGAAQRFSSSGEGAEARPLTIGQLANEWRAEAGIVRERPSDAEIDERSYRLGRQDRAIEDAAALDEAAAARPHPAEPREAEDWAAGLTRLEVIDEGGRALTRRPCKVELSFQDDGRTLKVFVRGGNAAAVPPAPGRQPMRQDKDDWLFTDQYGDTYRLRRTAIPHDPLIVVLEELAAGL